MKQYDEVLCNPRATPWDRNRTKVTQLTVLPGSAG